VEYYSGHTLIGKIFTQLFVAAKNEIFKLGVFQEYPGEDASPCRHAWEQGDYQQSIELFADDNRYKEWIALCLASPARVIRGQIVVEPWRPYLEWSLLCPFQQYQKHGAENLYILTDQNYRKAAGPSLPTSDFLVFDGTKALQWQCADDGNVIGGWTWDVDAGDNITAFLDVQDVFMRNAQPFVTDALPRPRH